MSEVLVLFVQLWFGINEINLNLSPVKLSKLGEKNTHTKKP